MCEKSYTNMDGPWSTALTRKFCLANLGIHTYASPTKSPEKKKSKNAERNNMVGTSTQRHTSKRSFHVSATTSQDEIKGLSLIITHGT